MATRFTNPVLRYAAVLVRLDIAASISIAAALLLWVMWH
jgi:hypothetical protein